MKRNIIIILGFILILTLSVLAFIRFSNDHIECNAVVINKLEKNGNKVVLEKHICKEKYNF